jgi:hypothetical protein
MSLHKSETDWGLVIEVFGYSPRAGLPDTHIYTFSSNLHQRKSALDFVSAAAHALYLSNNPFNESAFVFPIAEGDWLDADNQELIASGHHTVKVRGDTRALPTTEEYDRAGVLRSQPPRVAVFEFCRALAFLDRERVLATPVERTAHLEPSMRQILQLEEWHHPHVVDGGHRPSNSETFNLLAETLISGDPRNYRPTLRPNAHWTHWPEGGSL